MLMVFLVGAKPLSVMICRHLYSCLSISIFTGQTVLQEPHKVEGENRQSARKSIVAARDLPSGTNLSRDDLLFMRSGELGLPPDQDYHLIGQSTTRNIAAYQLISDKDVTSRQPS